MAGGNGRVKRRVGGLATVAVALVVAVVVAGAIAYGATRTFLSDAPGNHALSAVCDGEGEADAAAYNSDGEPSGLVALSRTDDGWNGSDSRSLSEIDLVACSSESDKPFRSLGCQTRSTQVSQEVRPDSAEAGEIVTYTADLYRITIEVREARTGALVATEHVTPPSSCPSGEDLVLDTDKEHKIVPSAEAEAAVAAFGGGAPDAEGDTPA